MVIVFEEPNDDLSSKQMSFYSAEVARCCAFYFVGRGSYTIRMAVGYSDKSEGLTAEEISWLQGVCEESEHLALDEA
jgi:hypothetical protein